MSEIKINTADGEQWARMYSACLSREQALTAERDKLREALELVLTRIEMEGRYDDVLHRRMVPYTTKARAALAEGGQDE